MSTITLVTSLVLTQAFVAFLYWITKWLSRPLCFEEYELWQSVPLQRLYYERLKKQFNRLRAQVPRVDSIIEHDGEYLAIAELASNKRTKDNLRIGNDYLHSGGPLYQWAIYNSDQLPNEILHDIYKAARELDVELLDNIVYNT